VLTGADEWWGKVATENADGSGLLYRRHRYYDPNSGQFTQEDPIGLAGGLNAYGFAGGDPVNYSDPFGLDACLHRGNCTQVQGGEQEGVAHDKAHDEAVAGGWMMALAFALLQQDADAAATSISESAIEPTEASPVEEEELPAIIYREGDPSPSNLTPGEGEDGVSYRSSLSNPIPKGLQPVFRKKYFGLETARLPKGSVDVDNNPPGHVTLRGVSVEAAKDAVTVRDKFPPATSNP
jgi:RHS repeat-associated protein